MERIRLLERPWQGNWPFSKERIKGKRTSSTSRIKRVEKRGEGLIHNEEKRGSLSEESKSKTAREGYLIYGKVFSSLCRPSYHYH